MSNEKTAYRAEESPLVRMEKALQEFSRALQETPPHAFHSGKPMPALMARLVAAGYRQVAKDFEKFADARTAEE